jgi:hypothetical protein
LGLCIEFPTNQPWPAWQIKFVLKDAALEQKWIAHALSSRNLLITIVIIILDNYRFPVRRPGVEHARKSNIVRRP